MIDLHCHILPGIDDGADSFEESLEMARRAVDDGIRILAATPHTLNNAFQNSSSEVADRVSMLQDTFKSYNLPLKLIVGSDAHLRQNMIGHVESGRAVTINNGMRYMLVEFPHHFIPPWYKDELSQLRLRKNITPIITHPERNLELQEHPEQIYELIQMGCLIQITGMSIIGDFGEAAMQCAHLLLKLRMAHVIASDAHDAVNRPPVLSNAVDAAIDITSDTVFAKSLVTTIPEAIIAGKPANIPEPLQPSSKKRLFRFW